MAESSDFEAILSWRLWFVMKATKMKLISSTNQIFCKCVLDKDDIAGNSFNK